MGLQLCSKLVEQSRGALTREARLCRLSVRRARTGRGVGARGSRGGERIVAQARVYRRRADVARARGRRPHLARRRLVPVNGALFVRRLKECASLSKHLFVVFRVVVGVRLGVPGVERRVAAEAGVADEGAPTRRRPGHGQQRCGRHLCLVRTQHCDAVLVGLGLHGADLRLLGLAHGQDACADRLLGCGAGLARAAAHGWVGRGVQSRHHAGSTVPQPRRTRARSRGAAAHLEAGGCRRDAPAHRSAKSCEARARSRIRRTERC